MNRSFLPHEPLFHEIQIAMIPIGQDLLIAQSMLRWAKNTLELKEHPTCLFSHNPIEKLSSLRKSTQELSRPLKELMLHVLEFSSFKSIEKSLIAFHKIYLTLPQIDSELHLLYLGEDLYSNFELLTKLLLFTDTLAKLVESSLILKKALLDELLNTLSFSLDRPKLPH